MQRETNDKRKCEELLEVESIIKRSKAEAIFKSTVTFSYFFPCKPQCTFLKKCGLLRLCTAERYLDKLKCLTTTTPTTTTHYCWIFPY